MVTGASSPVDDALSFNGHTDGSGAYVSVPSATALSLTQNFSLEAWVDWAGAGGYQVMLSKPHVDTPGSVGTGYALVVSNGQPCLALSTNAPSPNRVVCGVQALPPHAWAHVAATYDGQDGTIYVNGLAVATQTWGGSYSVATGSTALLIGREFANGLYDRSFGGQLDDVRVWNTVLAAATIRAWMRQTVTTAHPNYSNLVGYWQFDEGSGSTTADASGLSNTGTLVNAPTWVSSGVPLGIPLPPDYPAATTDYALLFNGNTDGSGAYVGVPSASALSLARNFSLEAWVNWTGAGGYRAFLSKPRVDTPSTVGTGYTLVVSNGQPCLALNTTASSPNRIVCAPALTPNVWTHVAATYDGRVVTVYVDGTAAASQDFGSVAGVSTGATALLLGREFINGLYDRSFPGQLDEVRVWNVLRTPQQIQQDMAVSLTGQEAGLVGYWRFDEGIGLSTTDGTGQSNTGALVNLPTWVAATTPSAAPVATLAPLDGLVPWHAHHNMSMARVLGAQIDLADGHVDVSASAMQLPGRGPDLAMGQTWDSVAAQAGVTTTAGQGWSSSVSPSIGGAMTGTLVYTDDTGATWPLTYTGSLSADGPYTAYSPPPGMPWQLTVTTAPTTAYTLTDFLTGATMSFDGQGRRVATGDAYGNENRLRFTGDPGPSSMVNDGGRSIQFLYGANGLLSDVESPLWVSGGSGRAGSQHVAYGYAPGTTQLQTITTAAGTGQGLTTTFAYSGALLTRVTTPYTQTAHTWSIAYDAQGRVVSISSPLSGTLGQPGFTPAYTTAFTYTPGRTVVVAGVGTTAALTTTYDLDAHGQPVAVTDGLNNRTAFAYDQNHDITRVTDARGNVTTNAYAYVGQYGSTGLVTETDQPAIAAYIPGNATSPVTTTYRYDPTTYDLLERDTAEGARTVYSYDGPRHQVTSVIDRLSSLSSCRQSFAVAHARPSRTISGAQVPPSRTIVGTHAHPSRKIGGVHKSGGRHRQITPHLRPHTDCAPTGDRWRGTINAYDAWGQLVATTDARGVIVPDTSVGQTPVAALNPTPPVAATRTYTYTPAGDLLSVSSPPLTTLNPSDAAQTTGPVTTTYGSDADGNQLTVTSPNGYVTTAGYDHQGRLTQLAQPTVALFDGSVRPPTATIGYDGDGNIVRTTDGAGDPTTRAYDPLGRLTSSTNAVDETTVLTYTATRLAQVLTPAGNLTSYTYDLAGRPSGTTDPLGTLTQYGLDAVGNTTAITVPLDTHGASSVDRRTYDGLNQLVTDTVGGTGELTATAPQTTTSSYDHDGNLVQAQAPNGDVTYRTYDYADQPRAVTVYPGLQGNQVTNPPPAASQTFALDPAGHLTDQLDFTQRDHAYTLDGAGRTAQRVDSYSGQTLTAITTTVGYDPNGNVRALSRQADGVSGTQPQASTATYNALDWLTSQDDGQGATAYGYDAAGRPRTQSLLGGTASVTATLDAAGRATEIDDNAAGPVATSLFSYTLDDRPYTATLGAGTANVQETRQYDANDRLLCSQTGGPTVSGQLLALSYAYAYSPLGVTTAISAYGATTCGGAPPSTAQALGYDAHGRLVSASGVAWGYDGNGNLTSVSRAPAVAGAQPISQTYYYANPDGSPPAGWLPNELVSVRYGSQPNGPLAAGYGYDAAGNTTAITTVNAAANSTTLRALTYDAQGHLTNVVSSDGVSVTVGYNARGLRATIAVSDAHPNTGPAASFSERLTYRGARVGQVAIVEGTASFTETFLYRPDGEPLELLYQNPSQGQPTPTPYWSVTNGRGDVVALTDNRGAVVDQYRYDPWGVLTSGGGTGVALAVEGVPQPLRYRGYWYDGWYDGAGQFNSGSYGSNDDRPLPWYALTNRAYDPRLERFLQPDPSSQDGVRSYAYCHDAPIDCSDPTGLMSQGEPPDPNPGTPLRLPGPYRAGRGVTPADGQLPLFPAEMGVETGVVVDGISIDPSSNAVVADGIGAPAGPSSDTLGPADPTTDVDAAVASARAARANFGQIPEGKVAGATESGERGLSGYGTRILRRQYGFDPSKYDEARQRAARIGFTFATEPRDNGVPGRFYGSHAEVQMPEIAPNEPFAVSEAMCPECQRYYTAIAQDTGMTQVVADPYRVRIFYPDGAVKVIRG